MGIAPLLVLTAAFAAGPASLDEVVALARSGAPQLALGLLDARQSSGELSRQEWIAAERERVHILAGAGAWRTLAERLAALPDGLPAPFVSWAAERRVEALLHLGEGEAALAVLQSLVWDDDPVDADSLRGLRMLIARAHRARGDTDAALSALNRYAQDHGRDDPVLRALHGQMLLEADRPADAVHVLGEVDDPLRWLASLRAAERPANAVFERAVRLGSARDERPVARRAAWRVAAEAAQRMGNRSAAVAALEHAFKSDIGNDTLPAVLEPSPSTLWDAYREWGRALGNAAQLIVGLDDEWYEAAEARADREPAQARALFAALAHDTREPGVAARAHARFAQLLAAEQGGARVMAALYLDSAPFDAIERAPAAVRAALVEPVLDKGDLVLAARLVADLDPPDGADAIGWDLRRARILVLAGRREEGRDVLATMLDARQDYDVDRVLQVLFDLQSADAHAEVLPLFAKVLDNPTVPAQTAREIHYWIGDSMAALGDHAGAARMYLRSAMLDDPYAMDRWAQTARFQAAESLARAGLAGDAASLLRMLLNASDDAGRRAMLQHRIDEIESGAR